jgi:hypothetical protein
MQAVFKFALADYSFGVDADGVGKAHLFRI